MNLMAPSVPDVNRVLQHRLLYLQATTLARQRRYDEAKACLLVLLETEPTSCLQTLLGKILAQQGQYEEAIAALEKALALDPHDEEAAAALKQARHMSTPLGRLGRWTIVVTWLAILSVGAVVSSRLIRSPDEPRPPAVVTVTPEPASWLSLNEIFQSYGEILERLEPFEALGLDAVPQYDGSNLTVVVSGAVPSEHLKQELRRLNGKFKSATIDVSSVSANHRYVIRRGDVLSTISKRLYGRSERWPDLWISNKQILHDPDVLIPGTTLYIP